MKIVTSLSYWVQFQVHTRENPSARVYYYQISNSGPTVFFFVMWWRSCIFGGILVKKLNRLIEFRVKKLSFFKRAATRTAGRRFVLKERMRISLGSRISPLLTTGQQTNFSFRLQRASWLQQQKTTDPSEINYTALSGTEKTINFSKILQKHQHYYIITFYIILFKKSWAL